LRPWSGLAGVVGDVVALAGPRLHPVGRRLRRVVTEPLGVVQPLVHRSSPSSSGHAPASRRRRPARTRGGAHANARTAPSYDHRHVDLGGLALVAGGWLGWLAYETWKLWRRGVGADAAESSGEIGHGDDGGGSRGDGGWGGRGGGGDGGA
jgi:hypothetical protein